MTVLTLNKWGHSYGVRIPKAFLKQMHLEEGDQFEMESDPAAKRLILNLMPRRKGWLEAFNQVNASLLTKEEPIMDFPNQFDEEEWTW